MNTLVYSRVRPSFGWSVSYNIGGPYLLGALESDKEVFVVKLVIRGGVIKILWENEIADVGVGVGEHDSAGGGVDDELVVALFALVFNRIVPVGYEDGGVDIDHRRRDVAAYDYLEGYPL